MSTTPLCENRVYIYSNNMNIGKSYRGLLVQLTGDNYFFGRYATIQGFFGYIEHTQYKDPSVKDDTSRCNWMYYLRSLPYRAKQLW